MHPSRKKAAPGEPDTAFVNLIKGWQKASFRLERVANASGEERVATDRAAAACL